MSFKLYFVGDIMEKIEEYFKNLKRIHFAIVITGVAIFFVAMFCYFLATFPHYQIFDYGVGYIRITPYLEPSPAIALFIGLLSFIGAIFINFYTTENSKENVLTQLKHSDEKKSLIKLRVMLDKLNCKNHLEIPIMKTEKIAKIQVFEAENRIEDYFYEEFIECFEKFKKSDEYYNYYTLPKKFKNIVDSIIDRTYEFSYENKNREEYSNNIDYLKKLFDDELSDKY